MFLATSRGRFALLSAVVVCATIAASALSRAVAQTAKGELSTEEVLTHQSREIMLVHGPLTLRPDFLPALKRTQDLAAEGSGAAAVILELASPPTPEVRAELEAAGALLEEHLGGTTYLFAISAKASAELEDMLSRKTIAGATLPPEAKILPAARRPIEIPEDVPAEAGQIEPSLAVEFLSLVEPDAARAALEELGLEIVEQLAPRTFAVRAGPGQAGRIANLPGVKTIDRGPVPFLPLNATGRRNAESDQAQRFSLGSPAPSYGGVTGNGVRIAVADSGVDQGHDDFDTVTATGGAGASRVYNPRPGSGSHGTHVASIAGGSGLNSEADAYPAFALRGHAPKSMIGDYAYMGSTYANYHAAIVNDSTDVSNHSYVQSYDGYGTAAQRLDEVVRGDADHAGSPIPARPQVWAAGNNGSGAQYGDEEGYYALFTSAKNTISVGSTDSRDNRVSDYSSLGPTFDGRIKPDVVAPGCNDSIGTGRRILAASSGSQGYTGKCGTSMAAPVVSGIVALMMEAYASTSSPVVDLRPSTYKAVLVQTARDMIKTAAFDNREFNNPDTGSPIVYHAGPDFATGYGLVDADAAVSTISDPNRWREATLSNSGEVDVYYFDVPQGADEFRITLAWDDEPGSTFTSITTPKLVNDLDLELVAPDGTIFRPWTLDPLPVTSNPGGGGQDPITSADVTPARHDIDRRNNVEMAHVPMPASGQWTVHVRAFNLPNGNPQTYSLVASERFSTSQPATHRIVSRTTPSRCMGVKHKVSEGANVQLYACSATDEHKDWSIKTSQRRICQTGDNVISYCVDFRAGAIDAIVTQEAGSKNNQSWLYDPQDHKFHGHDPKLCLDVESQSPNSQVKVMKCEGWKRYQEWNIQ